MTSPHGGEAGSDQAGDKAIIERLVEANEAELAKIRSLSYTARSTSRYAPDLGEPLAELVRVLSSREHGPLRATHVTETRRYSDDRPEWRSEVKGVRGEEMAAFWVVGTSNPQRWDLAPGEELKYRAFSSLDMAGAPDILALYGFGLGITPHLPLRRILEETGARRELENPAPDADGLYRIHTFRPHLPHPHVGTLVIDSTRGHLITEHVSFSGGRVSQIRKVEPIRVKGADGIEAWVPGRISRIVTEHASTSLRNGYGDETEIVLSDIRLNAPEDQVGYDIATLGLPERIEVYNETLSGAFEGYLHAGNGVLIPNDELNPGRGEIVSIRPPTTPIIPTTPTEAAQAQARQGGSDAPLNTAEPGVAASPGLWAGGALLILGGVVIVTYALVTRLRRRDAV